MKVKNTSGADRYVKLGKRGQNIANNATATFPDFDQDVLKDAIAAKTASRIDIIQGTEYLLPVASPACGYVKVSGAVSNNDTVTIKGLIFQFAANAGAVTAGNIWAGAGAAAGTAAGTLVTAINANKATTGVQAAAASAFGSVYIISLTATNGTVSSTGLTLAKSGTNLAVSAANLVDGADGKARLASFVKYTVTATDNTNDIVIVPTGLSSIGTYVINIVKLDATNGNSVLAFDGHINVAGGNIVISDDATVHLSTGDLIHVWATE